jgi:hypothetical protein
VRVRWGAGGRSMTIAPRKSGVGSSNKKAPDTRYITLTNQRRRQRLTLPVVANSASEKCIYAGGRKITPTHCNRWHNSISHASVRVLPIDSAVNTITTHINMMVNDLATRSRKLKENAYNSRENAVIATPAISIWLLVRNKINKILCQLKSTVESYNPFFVHLKYLAKKNAIS